MLKEKFKMVRWGLYVSNILLTIVSFHLAYLIRMIMLARKDVVVLPIERYSFLLLIVIPVWSVLLYYFGMYKSQRLKNISSIVWSITKVVVLGILVLNAVLFTIKIDFISRLFLAVFGISNILILSLWHTTVRLIVGYARKRDYNYRNILLVGTGKRAKELIKIVEGHKTWGLKLVGVIGDKMTSGTLCGYPVLGTIKDIPEIIHMHPVDEVMFCLPKSRLDELEDLFLLLEDEGINTRVAMNFFPNVVAKVQFEELHGVPFLTFTTVPASELLLFLKRVIDVIVSSLLLILLSPLLLVTACAIKMMSPGSILFNQERVGFHGRKFTMYKFRSMSEDAEEKKKDLINSNEMDGPMFKVKNDPRITSVGKFIRRLSIDELPQLWNVLTGDMSIVGPRPSLPSEVEQYERWQRRRLSVKPGLTCLWQVSGRNDIKFTEWMKLDLQYIDSWSLALDFKIFLKTIPAVIIGKGAV